MKWKYKKQSRNNYLILALIEKQLKKYIKVIKYNTKIITETRTISYTKTNKLI